jgi:hypothetical protein
MNPYINPAMQSQDLGGLNPVYQNMAAQQQFENQAAMQGQQLAQQAGQTAQQSNPMALAAALRKTDPNKPQAGLGQMVDANGNIVPDPTYGTGNAYGNMTSSEISNMQQNGV